MSVFIQNIPIGQISIPSRKRRLDQDKVRQLAGSIESIGLLNPITLTEHHRLIAGYHRLEAVKLLEWEEVPANLVTLSDLDLELAEIDENLIRAELTILERAEHLARRKELYEAKYGPAVPGAGKNQYTVPNETVSLGTLPFTEDTAQQTGYSRRSIEQDVQIATQIEEEVKRLLEDTPLADNKRALLSLARMVPDEQHKMAVHYSSDSMEWNTPPEIIERVIKVFGRIDLDPCSNSIASPNVPAKRHFTRQNDGLSKPWRGKVFVSPPYGRTLLDWVEHTASQFEQGAIKAAILLVPSRTDTQWFRRLRPYPKAFLFGRLKFSDHMNAAPFPSMAVYLGPNITRFVRTFSDIADIYTVIDSSS